jgi:uncharacterized integral membrane protein
MAQSSQPSSAGENRFSLSPKMIAGIVIGVLILIFVIQNSSSGKVNLLLWDLSAPRWLWMVILFGAGVVVGSMFPWLHRRSEAK